MPLENGGQGAACGGQSWLISGTIAAYPKTGFAKALSYYVDLSDEEYRQLHDDGHSPGLTYDHHEEFLVESVGQREEKDFIDFGIEYYRYRGEPGPVPAVG